MLSIKDNRSFMVLVIGNCNGDWHVNFVSPNGFLDNWCHNIS